MLTPYDYQITGRDFLVSKTQALLADEMGLGKTIQAILALDELKAMNVLIICPVIARTNWIEEFKIWGKLDRSYQVIKSSKESPIANVVTCSFDYATENFEKIKEKLWDCVIIDEAHFLKSTNAKRSKAILGKCGVISKTKRCWLLTGTPAPNHPGELWIMLYVFGVTKLCYDKFIQKFCLTRKTTYGLKIIGAREESIPELKELLSKIILRRLKKDVLKELPLITYTVKTIEAGEVNLEDHPSFLQYFYPVDRRAELKKIVTREQNLLDAFFESQKNKSEKNVSRHEIKVLSAMQSSVATIRRHTGLKKIDGTVELVKSYLEQYPEEKVVIFAIHRDVIEGIRQKLFTDYKAVSVYGRTSPDRRDKKLKKFQTNPKCRVFIGNVLAAGTAINLTVARKVYFAEADWVPGNNAQAVMRCHRIGQERRVNVDFICLAGSIDKHIMCLIKKKTKQLLKIFDE